MLSRFIFVPPRSFYFIDFFLLLLLHRNAFDEDRVPALVEDEAIRQDIHAVSSLLKMYFRELPNPLCTYQLYGQFVNAVQGPDNLRVIRMREVCIIIFFVSRPVSDIFLSFLCTCSY